MVRTTLVRALLFMLLATSALASAGQDRFVGSYVADLSKAPAKSRGSLGAFFRFRLRLSPDGRFWMGTGGPSGFWRVENKKLTLVNSRFFNLTFPEPDALLKKKIPESQLEGFVCKLERDGSIRFSAIGSVKGPFFYRKQKPRKTIDLLRISNSWDEELDDAYSELADEKQGRKEDILHAINNPKLNLDTRMWACYFIPKARNEQDHIRLIKLFRELDISGMKNNEWKPLYAALSTALVRDPSPASIDALKVWVSEGLVRKYYYPKAVSVLGDKRYVADMIGLLTTGDLSSRIYACKALSKCGDRKALPALRALQSDLHIKEPLSNLDLEIQLEVHIAVIGLTDNSDEKETLILKLRRYLSKIKYSDQTIFPALGASGSKTAMKVLIDIMLTSKDEFEQRQAAEELGNMGSKEAIPALKKALTLKGGASNVEPFGDMYRQKAIVEAIWKLEHSD